MADLIREKLKHGDAKVVQKVDQKSKVWEKFGQVVLSDETVTGYVICLVCEALYKYDGHKTGTSNLLRHSCRGTAPQPNKPTQDQSEQPLISVFMKSKVPLAAKSKLVDDFVAFCCSDLRPFDVVSGKGFTRVAQGLINIGARFGSVDVNSVLPHRQTICDRAKQQAKKGKESLIHQIENAMEHGIGITTDMWTDSFNMRSYTVLTCHFISDDWKLLSRVISTLEFDHTLRKTAPNIQEQITKELLEVGISPDNLSKVVFVSDQGPNIKAALKNYSWVPCAAHVINTILKHTFDEKDAPDFMGDVTDQITQCKHLVAYLKKSGSTLSLPHAVVQESETRWNTKAEMLNSIARQHNEIRQLLEEKGQEHRFEGIQVEVLNGVGEFLTPFKHASEDLEGDRYPTINSVLLWSHRLRRHCEPRCGDPLYMQHIRRRAGELLDEKMIISPIHKIATFLSPRFKTLKMLPPDESLAVQAEARRLTTALIPALQAQSTQSTSQGKLKPQCGIK